MQKEAWYVVAAALIFGIVPFAGQVFLDAGLNVFEISILPFIISTIVLLPFILLRKSMRIDWTLWKIFLLFGIINVPLTLGQFTALNLGIPVTVVALLLCTHPIWTIIMGKIFLKERITASKIIACVLVMIGAFILINPRVDAPLNTFGVIMALIAGFGLAAWTVAGNYAAKTSAHPLTVKFTSGIFFLVVMFAAWPLFEKSTASDLSTQIWIYMVIFALLTQVIAHFILFKGFLKVQAGTGAIILLLQTIVAAILAYAFLDQQLTWNIAIGGTMIILANYVVIRKTSFEN